METMTPKKLATAELVDELTDRWFVLGLEDRTMDALEATRTIARELNLDYDDLLRRIGRRGIELGLVNRIRGEPVPKPSRIPPTIH